MKRAPKNLNPEARKWFYRIQKEYEITDEGGLLLLITAMEAFCRMKEAQKEIKKDGPTIIDRFGQQKAHPLLTVERDSRAAMLNALKALNLDFEPIKKIGRPGGY